MEWVRASHDGVTLVARVEGAGPDVLLLHGWPDTGALWDEVAPRLVAAGHRVIVPDLRGCGRSDKPREVERYAMHHLVADALAVLDAAGSTRAGVVGHDWGAALAWALATYHPERVRALVAMSVGHPSAFRSGCIAQQMRSWYTLLFALEGVGERFVRFNDHEVLRTWFAHPRAEAVIAELERDGQLSTHLNWYRANLPPDAFLSDPPVLPDLAVPALGIWSSGDRALTEEQMTGSARYCAAGFDYVRLEGPGHWIPLEAGDEVTKVLSTFRPLSR